MRRGVARWVFLGSAVGFAGLALGLARVPRGPSMPTVHLQDGSWATLAGATFRSPAATLVGGRKVLLPASGTLTVWFHDSGSWGFGPLVGLNVGTPVDELVLRGHAGEEWSPRDRRDGPSLPHGRLRGYEFPVFPRRSPRLWLRVYSRTSILTPLAEARVRDFSLPMPEPGQYATWRPEAFPVRRRTGDLSVALTALRTGVEFGSAAKPESDPGLAAKLASFRVSPDTPRAAEWEPVEIWFSDATGNREGGYEDQIVREEGELGCSSSGQLPVDEPAWKVRAEFSRCRSPGARPDYIWRVERFILPVPGAPRWQPPRITGRGLALRLLACGAYSGSTRVRLQLGLPRADLRLTFRGTDQRGVAFSHDNPDSRQRVLGGREP